MENKLQISPLHPVRLQDLPRTPNLFVNSRDEKAPSKVKISITSMTQNFIVFLENNKLKIIFESNQLILRKNLIKSI